MCSTESTIPPCADNASRPDRTAGERSDAGGSARLPGSAGTPAPWPGNGGFLRSRHGGRLLARGARQDGHHDHPEAALQGQAVRLAEAGVLFPGGSHRAQRLAVYDLLGQRVPGEDKEIVAGSFHRLVTEMAAHDGRSAVVSEEELSLARPRHVRRFVGALGEQRVVVVIGVRDLARTLVSAWQQSVVTGGVTPWQDFIDSVRGDRQVPATSEGVSFWLRHDLLRVVDTWSRFVPTDQIRVVTVPWAGADSRILLERFARAAELPAQAWQPEAARPRNVFLGCAELEVVRRLNLAIGSRLNLAQYRFVIEAGIRPRAGACDLTVAGASAGAPGVGGGTWRTPLDRAAAPRRAGLRRQCRAVAGPGAPVGPTTRRGERERAARGGGGGADLTVARTRSPLPALQEDVRQQRGPVAEQTEVLGSRPRAAGFRVQKAALRRSDSSRMLAWAARRYLSWTSPTPPRRDRTGG